MATKRTKKAKEKKNRSRKVEKKKNGRILAFFFSLEEKEKRLKTMARSLCFRSNIDALRVRNGIGGSGKSSKTHQVAVFHSGSQTHSKQKEREKEKSHFPSPWLHLVDVKAHHSILLEQRERNSEKETKKKKD